MEDLVNSALDFLSASEKSQDHFLIQKTLKVKNSMHVNVSVLKTSFNQISMKLISTGFLTFI